MSKTKTPVPLLTAPEPTYYLTTEGFTVGVQAYALQPEREYLHFLSAVGSQTALKAVRAALRRNGDSEAAIHLQSPDPAESIEFGYRQFRLHPYDREKWRSAIARLPSGQHHMLLYPTFAIPEPDLEETNRHSGFLMLCPEDEEPEARFHFYVDRRSDLPIHPYWAKWLWQRSLHNTEATPLETAGIKAWTCYVNQSKLREDLSQAVSKGLLNIPPEG